MTESSNDFILQLKRKDVIGLYISLKHSDNYLTDSSAMIMKKIEDYLFTFLTIDQFENIEDVYARFHDNQVDCHYSRL